MKAAIAGIKKILADPRSLLILRLLIGLLFFYSGLSKLTRPIEYFEVAISQYDIIPERLVHLVALIIPWVELIISSYVIIGYRLAGSAAILGVLTAMFQLILGQALVRGLPMDECGCFGGGFIHLTLYQSFALDTFLLLVLIQIASADKSLFSFDNLASRN